MLENEEICIRNWAHPLAQVNKWQNKKSTTLGCSWYKKRGLGDAPVGTWALLEPPVGGIDRSTAESAADGQGGGGENGRQGRPFSTFAMSHCSQS